MNFSPSGLRNYRLCLKVDCTSIMLATDREKERKVEKAKARMVETETEGENGGRRETERGKPKVQNVQLTPPY